MWNIKNIAAGVCSVALLAITSIGCSSERTTYSSGDYIVFADSINIFPVVDNENQFDVKVVATTTRDYDRNVGVEVLINKTNAIEGEHFFLESQTVTIKAGQMVGSFKVGGISENIGVSDSLGVTFRLLNDVNQSWDIYPTNGQETSVILHKACGFDLETFTGYCILRSGFFKDYLPFVDMRLLYAEIDEERENSIVIRNFFYDGYDLSVRLDNDNILYPDLYTVEDQVIGDTREAFGTIYGDGKLLAYTPSNYLSYFSSCEEFMNIFLRLYVANVGTVGTFQNALKFITDEEAEIYKNQGY